MHKVYDIVKRYKPFFKVNIIVFIAVVVMLAVNAVALSAHGGFEQVKTVFLDMKAVLIVSGCATLFYFAVIYKMKADGVDTGPALFQKKRKESVAADMQPGSAVKPEKAESDKNKKV